MTGDRGQRRRSILATSAGIAWFAAAASLAFVALVHGSPAEDQPWGLVAWSGPAAAIAVYLALSLLSVPGPRYQAASMLGAIVLLAVAVHHVANRSDIFVVPSIWAVAAGGLSLVDAWHRPRPTAGGRATTTDGPPSLQIEARAASTEASKPTPAHHEAVLVSPIVRLRSARPGAYTPSTSVPPGGYAPPSAVGATPTPDRVEPPPRGRTRLGRLMARLRPRRR